jgi:hypothetical protein
MRLQIIQMMANQKINQTETLGVSILSFTGNQSLLKSFRNFK